MSCAINMWLKHSKIVDKNKERGLSELKTKRNGKQRLMMLGVAVPIHASCLQDLGREMLVTLHILFHAVQPASGI